MYRSTRSQARQASLKGATTESSTPTAPVSHIVLKDPPTGSSDIDILPSTFTPKITGLSRKSTGLLKHKREKLRMHNNQLRRFIYEEAAVSGNANNAPALIRAVQSALVFAQEEAGSAVCISPSGLLLTCSHCVADDAATALDPTTPPHWLIFATGEVVKAVCVAWDPQRDLALLRVIAAEPPTLPQSQFLSHSHSNPKSMHQTLTFPHASLFPSSHPLQPSTPLLCIGHPGSEDLEVSKPGVATGYDVLHISSGAYRGLALGQDAQDNSEIGALMHDCWTYWGHSGAPLLERRTGELVGLHSSWDEETGMRRGVPGEAVRAFLGEYTEVRV
ncbi:trypsin-like serine protease [Trematosphaeria pertusa]|uniref:Trypsin-like serine protease n=1 Tax=Trematosphaeria pertusa TaxID=390896 RepID=A0A6A6HXB4_9PLEO|nr:trypsin-like serine protease [Trematosphaeria pertusa]KAF2242844.1 trypsin-like serine protease [Trematosphaeria pertusa]